RHQEIIMSRSITRFAAIVWAMCATSACSKSRANTASAATRDPAGASASAGGDTSAVVLDCSTVFSPNDAVGLIKGPVTISQGPSSNRWCAFDNEGSAEIMVRSGSSGNDEQMWNEATMSTRSEQARDAAQRDPHPFGPIVQLIAQFVEELLHFEQRDQRVVGARVVAREKRRAHIALPVRGGDLRLRVHA